MRSDRLLPHKEGPVKLARIILFTNQMDAMSRFYGEILGLLQVTKEKGWQEFSAGGTNIALHSGPSSPGKKGPKIVFHSEDVPALRETLVARGATFGKARQGDLFCLCDGKDPDGNPIQLSNRRACLGTISTLRLHHRRSTTNVELS